MNVKGNYNYLKTVLRHKFFVFYAGLHTKAPIWRLIIHDWTKFGRSEWGPYVRRFEGGRAGGMNHDFEPSEWHRAFLHHCNYNPHHWEHWLTRKGTALEMPDAFVREMVADWMGAGRAYTGAWDIDEWYEKNKDRIILHKKTRAKVEGIMARVRAERQSKKDFA